MSGVMVDPASAIGGPLLAVILKSYVEAEPDLDFIANMLLE